MAKDGQKQMDTREALYRFNYMTGAGTVRIARRLWYATRRPRRALLRGWKKYIAEPVGGAFSRIRQMFAHCPVAWRELRTADEDERPGVLTAFFHLCRRARVSYRNELSLLWALIGPTAALAVLLITVSVWSHTAFCLSLTYEGQKLGYIDREGVYDAAAALAKGRVVNVDQSFSVAAVPEVAITVQGSAPVLSDTELCDAILRTKGDSIAQAVGLYVDGAFMGAVESTEELTAMLEGIKAEYYDTADPDQRAEFVQEVTTVEGLYPSPTVVDPGKLRDDLTAEAESRLVYTVVKGDTLSGIAQKHALTAAELRSLNPRLEEDDTIRPGDDLVVRKAQTFIRVKVITTIRYTESIPYNSQTVFDSTRKVTYSKVTTRGVKGSQDVVAEITTQGGAEIGREVVQVTVTRQPVTEVTVRGTQKVITQGGTEVVIGDGITTGKMKWPVPICHNMSRGYRRGHYGIDICNGPVTVRGKPCQAADGGVVVEANTGWNGGYGNVIKIRHSNGLYTVYAHLQSIQVVSGQTVSKGQQIALIGNTGNSDGPHLHFEVWSNGTRVNPLNYVKP